MSSKQRASLRRKLKVSKHENETDDSAFEEMKSPARKRGTGQTNSVLSPRFRSPVVRSKLCKPSLSSEETPLDESLDALSQEPTPSKWSSLLPDFNSQSDEVVGEVLWDCSSPDAVKHLRRLQKGDRSIKEIIKYFKPSKEGYSRSPPLQLQLLRASLQKQAQKQHKPPDTEKRKQRKLAQKRKQAQERREREKQLFGQILSSVEESKPDVEQQQETDQWETSTVTGNTAAGEDDDDGNDDDGDEEDDWEDDDLFENSVIIAATQDPYQFASAACSKTSTPKHITNHTVSKPRSNAKATVVNSERRDRPAGVPEVIGHNAAPCGTGLVEDRLHASNDSSAADSQSSCVIPPTFAPAGSKLICVPQDSAVSRLPLQKRNIIAPRNLIGSFVQAVESTPSVAELSAGAVCETGTDVPTRNDRLVIQAVSRLPHQCPDGTKPQCPDGTKPQCLSSGVKSKAMPRSVSRSGCKSTHPANIRQPVAVPGSVIPTADRQSKATKAQYCVGKKHSVPVQQADRKTRSAQTPQPASLSSSVRLSDVPDDGLSDEMLLRLTEHDGEMDSQVIQEFPTQAPTKLSAPATLVCAKLVRCEVEDFADDLDPDLLASIGEFDSFSESPKGVEKTRGQQTLKPMLQKPSQTLIKSCPTDNKKARLQMGKQPKTSAYNSGTGSVGKSRGVAAGPAAVSKPVIHSSDNRLQRHRDRPSSVAHRHMQPSDRPAAEASRGLVYPPFAQNQQHNSLPLSSLAGGNTVVERPPQAGKSFVFKPLTSSSSASRASRIGPHNSSRTAPSSDSGANAVSGHWTDASRVKAGQDGGDDMIEDDPLFESQIMAMLDQVETQASQQSASQQPSSQGTASAPMCSQEEIEKKRQAAMQRRRQAGVKRK